MYINLQLYINRKLVISDKELDDRTKKEHNLPPAKDTAITWNKFFMKLAHKSTERPGIDPIPEYIVKIDTILSHTSYNFIIARSMYSVTT